MTDCHNNETLLPNWQKEPWQTAEYASRYVRPERISKWPNSVTDMIMMMMMMTTFAEFRCRCTNALSSSDNRVLMVLHKYCLKWTGKFQQCFTFFKILKIGSTFCPNSFPTYVCTDGRTKLRRFSNAPQCIQSDIASCSVTKFLHFTPA